MDYTAPKFPSKELGLQCLQEAGEPVGIHGYMQQPGSFQFYRSLSN